MFSVHLISDQLSNLQAGKIGLAEFGEWFLDESAGHVKGKGDPLSEAIFSIEMALARFDLEEIDSNEVLAELKEAIRPCVESNVYCAYELSAPRSRSSTHANSAGVVCTVSVGPAFQRFIQLEKKATGLYHHLPLASQVA